MTMGLVNAARQIESYGMGPDRQLAHISPDEAQLMDTLQGGRRVNPMTGLPQYGTFGKILKAVARVGATFVGAMLTPGAPWVGAALGNAAATKLTGGSWKDAAIGGTTAGITAGMAPAGSFGSAAGSGTFAATSEGMSGFGSAATSAAAPLTFRSALGQAGTFAMNNPGTTLGMAAPGIASAFQPTPAKASTGDPDFMTPDSSFGGGTLRDAGDRLASRGVTKYGGYDIPRNPTTLQGIARPGENPMDQNFGGFAGGGNVQPTGLMGASQLGYVNAKRGGTIRGPGDGKSDDIPALLSNNEHVIDAATVADAGNGDSDAGHKVFEKIKQKIRKNAGRKNPKRPSPKQRGLGSLMRAA